MVFSELFEKAQKLRKSEETRKNRPAPSEPSLSRPSQKQHNVKSSPTRRKPGSNAHKKKDSKPESRSNKKDDDHSSRKRKHRHHGSHEGGRSPQRRQPPDPAAIRLSQELQECSRQKQLEKALKLYEENRNIRDLHHACIVLDCCARCGAMDEAERLVSDLRAQGISLNVASQTALLKGYAHAGRMHQAAALFRTMCQDTKRPPNVRTLNTVLRGCLWMAATPSSEEDGTTAGGVVTSEEAWKLYCESVGEASLDSSSFEMSVAILCQALRTKEAEKRVAEFQTRHGIRFRRKASLVGDGDQASLESLAAMLLGLARAYGLLWRFDDAWRSCQRALSSVHASRAAGTPSLEHSSADDSAPSRKKRKVQGGKRSWKNNKDGDDNQEMRREASNAAFREHRLSELEGQARDLLKLRANKNFVSSHSSQNLAQLLLRRFFYFGGGGTTDLEATRSNQERTKDLAVSTYSISSTWLSFGLSQLVDGDFDTDELETTRVYDAVGLGGCRVLRNDGRIDFAAVFPSKKKKRPLIVELGSGFGDWVVHQARSRPSHDYVAVELRSDRVSQILCRAVLLGGGDEPLSNVCVVGSECGSFLRDRVGSKVVSAVFANFPEPPTQMYGRDDDSLETIMAGGQEPAHMLNSSTLETAARSLQIGGRIVIVSDNRVYAKLLCATVVKAMRQFEDVGLRSLSHDELKSSGLRQVETFPSAKAKEVTRVALYEGRPNESVGHYDSNNQAGGSYFDRLWRSGASAHSERLNRFVIVMIRV